MKMYIEFDGSIQIKWLDKEDLIIKEQEMINNFYKPIGNFKLTNLNILLMIHTNETTILKYLIIVKWKEILKELYYFDTKKGAIEMFKQMIL